MIEIDGQYHNLEEKFSADQTRDEELKAYDLTILRFTEQEIRKDMVNVLRTIENHVLEHTPKLRREENSDY